MKSPSQELEAARGEGEEEAVAYPARRLTMIPAKYKLKEERRKLLKISINKLKKIEDPESSLCRSVLINNTMRKLQKEAREEKMLKQMSLYAKSYFPNGSECQLNYNNNNTCKDNIEDCVYQRDGEKRSNKLKMVKVVESSLTTNGVSLNEDVVEKIPSIKRCSSRKRSVDQDGPGSEVVMLKEEDPPKELPISPTIEEDRTKQDLDDMDVEDCDVHDVLSQLYLPPTPRLLTTIDSDTDDDQLNVVDMDIGEPPKSDESQPPSKKPRLESAGEAGSNFLCGDKVVYADRTCVAKEDEEVIELEDEEDIKKRLSQSLSNYRKSDVFFEETSSVLDNCDSLYSCGHTSLFNDIHSVTFHNLIASLET